MDAKYAGLRRDCGISGWRPDGCDRVALILQGGGASAPIRPASTRRCMKASIEPDWVTGVSIGGINAAIIAGNRRENRLPRLREFWDRITSRKIWHYTPDGDIFRQMRNATSALMTMLTASRASSSRIPQPLVQPGRRPHRDQLLRQLAPAQDAARPRRFLADQRPQDPLLGRRGQRADRQLRLFRQSRRGDHARSMSWRAARCRRLCRWSRSAPIITGTAASSPTRRCSICSTRTTSINTLVFQVDLFSARGPLPREMSDVLGRHKDITYSSRTRYNTDLFRKLQKWKLGPTRRWRAFPKRF